MSYYCSTKSISLLTLLCKKQNIKHIKHPYQIKEQGYYVSVNDFYGIRIFLLDAKYSIKRNKHNLF